MGSVNRKSGEGEGRWGCILTVLVGITMLAAAGWFTVRNDVNREKRRAVQVERGRMRGITKDATVRVRVDGRRVVVLSIDEEGRVLCMIPGEHTTGIFGGSKSQYYRGWFPISALEPLEGSE